MQDNLQVYKVSENASLPSFASSFSDCFDIRACFDGREVKIRNSNTLYVSTVSPKKDDSIWMYPDDCVMCPTGLIFIMNQNNAMHIYNRSSLVWKYNISVANAPGIIDADYTDELFILLKNNSDIRFTITHDMRIAQAKLVHCITSSINIEEINKNEYEEAKNNIIKLSEGIGNVRTGGIGSTGLV